jgi:hypothetical protein
MMVKKWMLIALSCLGLGSVVIASAAHAKSADMKLRLTIPSPEVLQPKPVSAVEQPIVNPSTGTLPELENPATPVAETPTETPTRPTRSENAEPCPACGMG